MSHRPIQTTIILIAIALCHGCTTQSSHTGVRPTLDVTHPPKQAYITALEVLGRMHFDIAQADENLYYIRTQPLSGAQWFEFWRQDNASWAAFNEANLQSIRRIAEIQINPQSEKTAITCRVHTQRLSVPPRPTQSSSQVYRMITDSEPMAQRLSFNEDQKRTMAWIDLGEDPDLAERILKKMNRALARN